MNYYKASIENGGMRDFNILVRANDTASASKLAKQFFEFSGFDSTRDIKVESFDIDLLTVQNCDKIFDCDYIIDKDYSKSVTMLDEIIDDKDIER